mmetsp:Transcript_11190/g.25069  ORF Transcript_11190/g.25069 Transcript_11190/m.25069 type:complete len:161 (-) Transcript_11190:16-498(-)
MPGGDDEDSPTPSQSRLVSAEKTNSFHFDPIATVVQVDFPSRREGGAPAYQRIGGSSPTTPVEAPGDVHFADRHRLGSDLANQGPSKFFSLCCPSTGIVLAGATQDISASGPDKPNGAAAPMRTPMDVGRRLSMRPGVFSWTPSQRAAGTRHIQSSIPGR